MDYFTKKLTKTITKSLAASNPKQQPQHPQYQQQPGLQVASPSPYGVPPQSPYSQPSIPGTSPYQQLAFDQNPALQQNFAHYQQAQQQAHQENQYLQQALHAAQGKSQQATEHLKAQLQQIQQHYLQQNQQQWPQQQQQPWASTQQQQNFFELPASQSTRPQSQYAPSPSIPSSSTPLPVSPVSTLHSQYSQLSSPPPPPPRPVSQQYAQYTPQVPPPPQQFNSQAGSATPGPPPAIPRRSVPPPYNPQQPQSPTQSTYTRQAQPQSPTQPTTPSELTQRPQIVTASSAPQAHASAQETARPVPPPRPQRQATATGSEGYQQQPIYEAPATPAISVTQPAPPIQSSQTWPTSNHQPFPNASRPPQPSPGPEGQTYSSPPEQQVYASPPRPSPKPEQRYSSPAQQSPLPEQQKYINPPQLPESHRYSSPPQPSPAQEQRYASPPQQQQQQQPYPGQEQTYGNPPQPASRPEQHNYSAHTHIPAYVPAPPKEEPVLAPGPTRTDSYVPSYLESSAPTPAPSISTTASNFQAPPSPYMGATVASPASTYSSLSQNFSGLSAAGASPHPQSISPQPQSIYASSTNSPMPTPSGTIDSYASSLTPSQTSQVPPSIYSVNQPTTAPSSIYNPTGSVYGGASASERWGSMSEATYIGSETSGGPSKVQKKTKPMMPDGPQRVAGMGGGKKMRKILSLDGGGVRGLSTLIILRYIMEQLDEERGFHLEPWQEFDLIGGTSTGGLLAIMLGRLRMSIDECEDAYLQLSQRIFTPARKDVNVAGKVYDFLKANGKFDAKPLEEIVKHLLIARGLSEDELLLDKDDESCKIFVCAVSGGNDSTVRIRSYKTRDHDPLLRHCKVWEAARATSAASRLFDPITIGPRKQEFVDGALRHNNPIQIVDLESDELFPGEDRFIISIGTGSAPGSAVTGNLMELMQTLKKIVTDSEEKNSIFRAKNIEMVRDGRLYRFNVFHGLADVGLHEHEHVNLIADHTDAYLRLPDTRNDVINCVRTMKECGQRLDYIGGKDLEIHLEKLQLSEVAAEICMHCHAGIPFNEKAFYCPDAACMFFMCLSCQGQHFHEHIRQHIRFDLIQWQAKMVGVEPESDCKHCNKDVKARFQCKDCADNLCFECWGNMQVQKSVMAQHATQRPQERRWVAIYPPNWCVNKQVPEGCSCMNSNVGFVMHCERCYGLTMTINSYYYRCATCMKDYNAAQSICRSCFDAEDAEHKAKHNFQEIWLAFADEKLESLEDEVARAVRCKQCPGKEIAVGYMSYHQHLSVTLVLGPAYLETIRRISVSSCRKVELNRASAKIPENRINNMTCDFCVSTLQYDTPYNCCLISDCVSVYCQTCSATGRHQHRHPLYSLVIKRVPMALPANFSFSSGNMRGVCDYCGETWIHGFYSGLECQDCKNRHCCLVTCLANVNKTRKAKTPPGLPHEGCVGRNWVLWHPGG